MRDVEERICRFVQRHLGLPRDEAYAVQKKYLQRYGITLAGMMKHHGVDPDLYHAKINDIDALALTPNGEFRAALARLPGKRMVFTNNCGNFARQVLERLKIGDLFEDVIDIRALGYVPKPGDAAYAKMVSRALCEPQAIALFDDRACNLAPAFALGMTTVWLAETAATESDEAFIGHRTADLAAFLSSVRVH